MIQDIYPSKLKNEYIPCTPQAGDPCMIFDADGKMALCEKDGQLVFPTVSMLTGSVQSDSMPSDPLNNPDLPANAMGGKSIGSSVPADGIKHTVTPSFVYLFSLDDTRFFLPLAPVSFQKDGFSYYTIREVRNSFSGKEVFAAFTAYHLWRWYADNRRCGRCGGVLSPDQKERALRCPACGNLIYPRINPAVIVGVLKDDSLLITKYRRGYAHNALVAGFAEIGETLEETVAREVMEETGVTVKNIRYYKSQPWGMAQDLLVGFYCEADGDGEIRMDENELKEAGWVKRDEIVLQPGSLSLTNEMMRMFKEKRI